MLEPNEKIDSWWIVVKTDAGRPYLLTDLGIKKLPTRLAHNIDKFLWSLLPVTQKLRSHQK